MEKNALQPRIYYENFQHVYKHSSQSFQKQVVMFSSVIILSVKKTLNIELDLNLFQHFSFHNLFDLVHSGVHGETNTFTSSRSPELALRRTNFCSPENLFFSALMCLCVSEVTKILTHSRCKIPFCLSKIYLHCLWKDRRFWINDITLCYLCTTWLTSFNKWNKNSVSTVRFPGKWKWILIKEGPWIWKDF